MAGELRLGEIAQIIMGQSPPGETYNEKGEGLPFFQGVADFNYRHPTPRVYCSAPSRVARPGDILLSVRAPIGRVNVADRTCAIGRGLAIVRAQNPKDSRYLEFALRAKGFEWHTLEGRGSIFGNATRSDLETLAIPWPPENDRRAIAHILGTLDDKIELNRRMSETLEQMARAIFKAWFVDFEPVRAKMEGRWRRGESLPGLPAHLYDLFPDRLVHSELGEIPEGWKITSVNDEATIVKGVSYRSQDLSESDTALVTLKSINRGGGYRYDGLKAYNGTYTREQVIHPGDVIVAQTDVTQAGEVIGKPALVMPDLRYRVLVASLDVLVVRPRRRDPPREFFYLLFLTPQFQHHVRGYINGTTVLHLNKDALTGFRFASPPEQAMKVFAAIVGALFNQVLTLARETLALTDLRDALLPKLISGKLRVKDAKRFLKENGL